MIGLKDRDHPAAPGRQDQMSDESKSSDLKYVGVDYGTADLQVEDVYEPSKKLGWTCELRTGWEVKVFTDDYVDRMMDTDKDDNEAKTKIIESLPNLVDLEDGQVVLVMSIMGWVSGNVRLTSDIFAGPHVESGGHVFPLRFTDDDRKCWVTTSQINKAVFDLIGRNP